MDVILCHQTADFDALGAAVGLSRLKRGSQIVLTGGAHPAVRNFLALHRDELAIAQRRSIDPQKIRSLSIPDTQKRDRLGPCAQWLDLPQLEAIAVYDHHLDAEADLPTTICHIEPLGAIATLIAEHLQQANLSLSPSEATVMALGIHVDTGSLTFDSTTPRDIRALAWLMEQGASLRSIREYSDQSLSPELQHLLAEALECLQSETVWGYTVGWVQLDTDSFVPGLSGLAMRILELGDLDALLLVHQYYRRSGEGQRLTLIGRSRIPHTNLNALFEPLGGGGHSQAASATMRDIEADRAIAQFLEQFTAQIPQPQTARDLMSSPARTIRPNTTIGEAHRILLRYGHSGLSVVDENDRLVGVISRRDLDIALHHGFSHAPVKGYMSKNLKTISPDTTLPEIESLMVTYDIGRLPVVEGENLIGIVTRTDVLRERQPEGDGATGRRGWIADRVDAPQKRIWAAQFIAGETGRRGDVWQQLKSAIPAAIWQFLECAAEAARERGWHLYLVGGAVRDLLLVEEGITAHGQAFLQDIDLVVDGFHRTADAGAGVELAKALQKAYPAARLEVHGAFQTAALLWHKDATLDSLAVDIATARTEFYPYPAANPEVEASSIRQDLYRRDFTINALALRLSAPRSGELLDFFGGMLDLRSRLVRVLHANSFIEDPTRIYRAVRFAVRLGFEIESQTEQYIRYAIESGVYDRLRLTRRRAPALTTRLKTEFKYLLEAQYWKKALHKLASLGALRCLHPALELTATLEWQLRLLERGLKRFDAEQHLVPWQMRLEVLLAHLPPSERATVAANLQLSADSSERLSYLERTEAEVMEKLSYHSKFKTEEIEKNVSQSSILAPSLRPSEVVMFLRRYQLPMLVLLVLRMPLSVRRHIWHYLAYGSHIRPPLNGNDLKALGYSPGPQFKQILDDLLMATIDGMVCDRASAEAFVRQNYTSS
jgi:tRNA nucleotidyltransferase (CCA-adding enzyme)